MAADYPTGHPTIEFPFAAIPAELLYDDSVSSTAVRIYGVLARIAFEVGAGNVEVTHEEIAVRLKCSPRSVARPLGDLESRGWIERRKTNSWMGRGPDHYHLRQYRAESRTGVGAQYAKSRGGDHAESRGPTSLKEVRENDGAQSLDISTPTKRENLEAEFLEWWAGIWDKDAKQGCMKHYIRIRSKGHATREFMFLQRDAYIRLETSQGTPARYWKSPLKWLSDGKWENDFEIKLEEAEIERREEAARKFTGPEMRIG